MPLTETTLPPKRAGIDIICVIDVSGSMGGQKLNLLKESLNYIVNMLKEQDRLCIIKFNDSAKIVFPLLSMDGAHKKIALRHISALRAIGGTNLMAAL